MIPWDWRSCECWQAHYINESWQVTLCHWWNYTNASQLTCVSWYDTNLSSVESLYSTEIKGNWYNDSTYSHPGWRRLISRVWLSVSKLLHFLDGIGYGIKIIGYKKVSESVSWKFGIRKKFRIRFRSDFGYRHTLDANKAIQGNVAKQVAPPG